MNSESRIVTPLSGTWQRSASDGTSQVELPFAEYNSGDIIYSKNIKIPDQLENNKQLHLFFLGLDTDVEITINDSFLGKYLGGMTPFLVKIPEDLLNESGSIKIQLKVIEPKENLLKIRTKSLDTRKNYYGILRDFYLVGTSNVWMSAFSNSSFQKDSILYFNNSLKISSFKLSSKEDSLGLVAGDLAKLRAEIYDNGALVRESEIEFKIENERVIDTNFVMPVDGLDLWSSESPKTYSVKYSILYKGISIDDITINTGIKIVSTSDDSFIANGENLKIKAVNYVEDLDGSPILNQQIIEEDVDRISKLGANAI